MFRYANGDLFQSGCEAAVVTVNCVGAMGKGIAETVRDRWPAYYAAYRRDCGIGLGCDGKPDGSIGPGKLQHAPACCEPGAKCRVHLIRPGQVGSRLVDDLHMKYILDFPTKRHWYGPSRLSDVEAGLQPMVRVIRGLGLRSVAIPPLGCGHGGLSWDVVRPLLVEAVALLPHVDVVLYLPPGHVPPLDGVSPPVS
jgi:O-acetyl-ADP-ribose deacetylase (regulator of RNase III)